MPPRPTPPTAWDINLYARLFTESPSTQLEGGKTADQVVMIALGQPQFASDVEELADEYGVPVDVIVHSVRRTLIWTQAVLGLISK